MARVANHPVFHRTSHILASVSRIPATVFPECKMSGILIQPDISASTMIHIEVHSNNQLDYASIT